MNCAECEQLFDAYLDGQLAGSLRLEFDAHRLRCARCQQTLAMLETIGHVLASDSQLPDLSAGFTDQVMRRVEQPQRVGRRRLRIAVIAGAVLPAAAAVMLAIVWPGQTMEPTPVGGPRAAGVEVLPPDAAPGEVMEMIAVEVEDRMWEAYAAGRNVTANFMDVARYLNITLPEEAVRESEKIANVHPLQGLMDALVGPPEEEAEPAVPADGVYAI